MKYRKIEEVLPNFLQLNVRSAAKSVSKSGMILAISNDYLIIGNDDLYADVGTIS